MDNSIEVPEENNALTKPERLRLAALEVAIERGLKSFVEVGLALQEIRDSKPPLYRATHATFEDYCRERWAMGRRYGNQLIEAADVVSSLGAIAPKPKNEAQARELAQLLPEQRIEVWEEITSDGEPPTAERIRAAVRALLARESEEAAGPIPGEGYRCIVIDPPWPVEKIEREERPNQGQHLDYPIMSLEQIEEKLRIILAAASTDGCHVYLWVTHKFLPAGLKLFEACGVTYQCVMTWVKPTGMTPYSWMYNTEHVLFGCRGAQRLEQMGLKLSFEAPVTRHSEKPDAFYDLVRQASPEPRLDAFSRRPLEGFTSWGTET